jgi:uncharacterized membrane protein
MKFKLLFKTMTYGIIHLCVAIAVAYAITRDLKMSLGIGIIEPIIQTAVFSIHDYLWERKNNSSKLY